MGVGAWERGSLGALDAWEALDAGGGGALEALDARCGEVRVDGRMTEPHRFNNQ